MVLRASNDKEEVTIDMRKKEDVPNETSRWWLEEDEDKIYQHTCAVAHKIRVATTMKSRQNYLYHQIYNDYNNSVSGYSISSLVGSFPNRRNNPRARNRISINVIQNCIDTAGSMIGKNQPKPQFVTSGAKDFQIKERAINLTKYVDGVFEENNLFDIDLKVFRDACIYGTGAVHWMIDKDKKKVVAEWVFIEELLVDLIDGKAEFPTTMHRLKLIPRDKLCVDYPDHYDKIMAAESGLARTFSSQSVADVVPVLYSWHLPSNSKSGDGMFAICISNATLHVEKYEKDYFPINVFRWYHQPDGFHGRGIAQEIYGIHVEVNETIRSAQAALRKCGIPIVFMESGSKITEDELGSNQIARIVHYQGSKPIFETPQAMNPETYNWIDSMIDKAYKMSGISAASAAGNKDPEVKSGIAIRETQDIAAGRFEDVGIRWERYKMDSARIVVDLSEELQKKVKSLSVKVRGRGRTMENIDFSAAVMDQSQYKIQVFSISGLPNTPAGRLDTLSEWVQNGWVTKEQAIQMARLPDLEDFETEITSTIDLMQMYISDIKNEQKYTPPATEINLDYAFTMINQEICRSLVQECEPIVITLLRRLRDQIKDFQNIAAPPPPPVDPNAPPQGAAPPQPVQGQ